MSTLRAILSFILLSFVMLGLAACGSSGSGGTDPFASSSQSNTNTNTGTGTKTGPIFGNISTVTGKTGITLATNLTSIDAANGQVVATAKVISDGAPVAGVPVNFSIVAPVNGPATIESGLTTVNTDSNGQAITRIVTGNASSTTNVILAATVTIGTQAATATTTFQIVRGTGVITVASIPVKSETVDPTVQPTVVFQQQIPVSLTDANGNPRVGAPVTMSVYTKSGTSSATITQSTVVTDSSGTAIFNTTVTMTSPNAGTSSVGSIIYKLATSDATPIVAYAASYFSVTSVAATANGPAIILTTDRSSYDTNDGSVLATAKITNNGQAATGAPVTFEVVAPVNGPATIESALRSVTTDSNGTAVTRITTGRVASATNVIIKAKATVGSSQISAFATFQLVPVLLTPVHSTMTLTPDHATAGIDSTVLLTANLTTPALPGLAQNQRVTFSLIPGTPASIPNPTVYTDSTGKAITALKVGIINSSTSIIVKATTTIDGIQITAYTTIQVVRQNSMIINFITTKVPTDPDGTLNTLSYKVPWDSAAVNVLLIQLVPFQVLDENGVPRPNVDVNFTYTSQGRSIVHIYAPTTVRTDDHGMGIMNVSVDMLVPVEPGGVNTDAIVYTANATVSGQNLSSYGGFIATILREPKP